MPCDISSHSCKLTLEHSHLNFIMYMKYDNVIMYDIFMWNWFKITLCDDVIFGIASSINEAIRDEIQWSIAQEIIGNTINQNTLVLWLHWFHYDMFIKIWKPWQNATLKTWFSGHKKVYSMNNTLVIKAFSSTWM